MGTTDVERTEALGGDHIQFLQASLTTSRGGRSRNTVSETPRGARLLLPSWARHPSTFTRCMRFTSPSPRRRPRLTQTHITVTLVYQSQGGGRD
jgi:hypothetical protein